VYWLELWALGFVNNEFRYRVSGLSTRIWGKSFKLKG
jgi:hypothetical protein